MRRGRLLRPRVIRSRRWDPDNSQWSKPHGSRQRGELYDLAQPLRSSGRFDDVTTTRTGTLPADVTPNTIGVRGEDLTEARLISEGRTPLGIQGESFHVTITLPDGTVVPEFEVKPDWLTVNDEFSDDDFLVIDLHESKATSVGRTPALTDNQAIFYDAVMSGYDIAIDVGRVSDEIADAALNRDILFGAVEIDDWRLS